MSQPLINWTCALCKSTDEKTRCGCDTVAYCCDEHFFADEPNHKDACWLFRYRRTRMEEEEERLRTKMIDLVSVEGVPVRLNVLEGLKRLRSGDLFRGTERYMEMRLEVIKALLKIKHYYAADMALDICLENHRLDRADNYGIRNLTAYLYLRTDRVQQCYDFVKWNQTTGKETTYGHGEPQLPYLNIHNADLLEKADVFIRWECELSHRIAITLVKIRLLQDVRNLHNSTAIRDRLPRELFDIIRGYLVNSDVADRRDIMNEYDQTHNIRKLEEQIVWLYGGVKAENWYFWDGLLDPEPNLAWKPEDWEEADVSEMQIELQDAYDAWAETPGAIDVIRSLEARDTEISWEMGDSEEERPDPQTDRIMTPVVAIFKSLQEQPQWMYNEGA